MIHILAMLCTVAMLSGCAATINPLDPLHTPVKFQCYDEATGLWTDCPTEMEPGMDCHEQEPVKEKQI